MYQNERSYSKNLRKFCFLILLSIIALNANFVKAQSSGHIEGKVLDGTTDEGLPGASVFFKGTAIGTATDIEGNYKIKNVAPGKHELVVSYVGYKKQVIPVTISSNKTLTLDIKLESDYVQGEEIVVTGQLQGQAQAINQQLSSDQIVNVVSEQKIKELPDANAAESVGRLPGVAVQRSGGEAATLMIRGLDPKFTNITVNGIQIPSTDADNRSVDLSAISQSTLTGIELYKALTPDQDADAIAGVVNLVTGQAKGEERVTLDLYGIYSGMNETTDQYRVAVQYNNRFFDGFLGIQAGVNTDKRDRSSESYSTGFNFVETTNGWESNTNGFSVSYTSLMRKRYGGNINIDINTGDGGNIKFINLYSQMSSKAMTSSRDYPVEDKVTYVGEASDGKGYQWNNSLIGENYLGALKINWALSHAYTRSETPFDHKMRFYENKSTTSGMMNLPNNDYKYLSGEYLVQYAYNDFDIAYLDKAWFNTGSNDERNYDAKIDLEYPIRLSEGIAGIVKAGYKFRNKTRHRDSHQKQTMYNLNGFCDYTFNNDGDVVEKDWGSSSWPDGYHALMTDYFSGSPSRMLNDNYLLNPVLDENLVREWYHFNKWGTDSTGKQLEYFELLEELRDQYKIEEKVHATYIMTKLNIGTFITLIAGARYEYESNNYNAHYIPKILGEFQAQYAQGMKDTVSNFSEEYWLPNVHLKIKPLDWLDLRFAVTKSISRPDYKMRIPELYVNSDAGEITCGNPNLQPAVAWNFDASVSLYASQYGLLTISGFRKNIDNIFYWLNDIMIINDAQATELGLPVEEYGPFKSYTLDMPVNTSGTKVWGYELDLQTHLSFLPGALQYIVVGANYSKIWSKTKYPRFQLVKSSTFPPTYTPTYYDTEDVLSGQTDYTANISVGYDYLGFSARVSGYFQGPYLSSISENYYEDVRQRSFSRWDVAFKQVFTDNVSVFLNVNNFTNVIEGSELVLDSRKGSNYLYGVSAELGLQLSLF